MWLRFRSSKKVKERNKELQLLAWELKALPKDDPRSWPWFHGSLPRPVAEELLKNDGDFLVRVTGTSSVDPHFVVSCRWKSQNLHYIVRKVLFYPGTINEVTKYCLEEECFDTVSDLITAYKTASKPLSAISQAVIARPIGRATALTRAAEKNRKKKKKKHATTIAKNNHSDYSELLDLPEEDSQEDSEVSDSDSEILSESLEDLVNNLVGTDKDSLRTSSQSGEADLSTSLEDKDSLIAPGIQYESNANVSTPQEENPRIDDLPPKSRVVHKSGSARDLNIHSENMNLSYDENPTVNKENELIENVLTEAEFDSMLLEDVFQYIENLNPRFIALNLTLVDFGEFGLLEESKESPVFDGFELILLPQGGKYRRHLMSRFQLLSSFVASTISLCSTDEDKFVFLRTWILVAMDLKTYIGNIFSFHAVLQGLCSLKPNVNFKSMWEMLRRRETNLALNFETLLIPIFKRLEQGNEPIPPNASIPDVTQIVSIIALEETSSDSSKNLTAIYEQVYEARSWQLKIGIFRQNVNAIIGSFKPDYKVARFFETETLLLFLKHVYYLEKKQCEADSSTKTSGTERETEL
ncbi:SH2 domain-containing protein 3A-like isoform X1 [Artemia franciscana]|uniref:SH2 domain-containing protein 3A-like isoform X1 n=1 Tax=Artemia franciscana TaxID=6661 RepID=UPI0032DB39FE